MSLTSNFDFCVELGINQVKEIFHLAFKSEDRYPHNVGPITLNLSGQQVTVNVLVLDDDDRPADLSFQDEKHILFSFPFQITAETPGSPDPSLSKVTLQARVEIPGLLDNWDEAGEEVLGLSFFNVTPNDVTIVTLEGLPSINIDNFLSAIHSRYDAIQHVYTLAGNTLVLYDGSRDSSLMPPNLATPFDIQAELVTSGGTEFLKVTAPIHVNVPLPGGGVYASYGRIIFHRQVVRTDTTVTVNMSVEPGPAPLKTKVELDNASFPHDLVIAQLTPLAVQAVNNFGTITEPAFSESAARQMIQDQVADYIKVRRYPVYSPKSGDPSQPLSTPVGFLLVADGVLSILLNRRNSAVPDSAPDNFLGSGSLALAVGRARVDELINASIEAQFPDLSSGGQNIHTDQGDATLESLNVEPSDPGAHGEGAGHLWVTGEAEVHIDCWPDPDVSFEGPIFIDTERQDTEQGCELVIQPRAGDFDFDQSCCDIFLDVIIPIVGWVMLIITESLIDEVGGELAADITSSQATLIKPMPPVVNGIAEVTGCLNSLNISSQGFVFPGDITIRRLGRSFEDLKDAGKLPRPDSH